MTLAQVPEDVLTGIDCRVDVMLVNALPPRIEVELVATGAGGSLCRMGRWVHRCASDLAMLVGNSFACRDNSGPVLADWLEEFASFLTGIPEPIRPLVGPTWRAQRAQRAAALAVQPPRRA